ncbi:tyrosine-type recombinase/integrase [Bacillus stratosphericus]|uniref:tyrosine-type recombinase/integrase n=1 Tax=Bacillus stratosphericus TaxID=293386 RepID=UPI001CFA07D2|nr:tyrosine-type recombinase/integrase [Bacillus stratosphericus]
MKITNTFFIVVLVNPTILQLQYKIKNIRLHDLRHTMVALLMEAGESISAIQRRAGHASARTTSDIYGHVTDEMKKSAANHFNKFEPKHLRNTKLEPGNLRPQVVPKVENNASYKIELPPCISRGN